MFQIGDRVKCVRCPETKTILPDMEGEVVTTTLRGNTPYIGVKWDVYVSGHDCGGRCEYGYGWWILKQDIQLIEDEQEYEDAVFNIEYILKVV